MISNAENYTKVIFRWTFFIACFALPIVVPHIHGKLVALMCVLGALNYKSWNLTSVAKHRSYLSLLFAFFALYVVGLTYSSNLTQGLANLESLGPLIVLSVFLLINGNELRPISDLGLICFTAGVISLNLLSLIFISYDVWDPQNLQSNLRLANNAIVKIHPAFLSMYISISILFLFDRYLPLHSTNRVRVGWVLFGLTVLVVFLIWINSRPGIFCFFTAAVFYIFSKYKASARVKALLVLSVILIVIVAIPFSRKRFIDAPLQVLQGSVSEQELINSNSAPIVARKHIIQSSIDLLKWPEIIYGYGTGDGKDELHKSFVAKGYMELAEAGMDAHNEYFAELHRHGLIGLSLLIALLGYVFVYARQTNAPLFGSFIILFVTTAIFENIFSAQKGATFFALLCPVLMIYHQQYSIRTQG
ncbi:MAG: O-antigen ligase family protein [Bacteroidota bacterium]